jgi:hypothetical protein
MEELKKLSDNLFKFLSPKKKRISIIGTIINLIIAVLQNSELGKKLHHLLIVGEI